LTDLVGATVELDGETVGKTPLPAPIHELALGEHALGVTAAGYLPFRETVTVRFQQSTRVVARLAAESTPAGADLVTAPVVGKRPAPRRWYHSSWFYVGAGLSAALLGGYIGYKLGQDPIIDCTSEPK